MTCLRPGGDRTGRKLTCGRPAGNLQLTGLINWPRQLPAPCRTLPGRLLEACGGTGRDRDFCGKQFFCGTLAGLSRSVGGHRSRLTGLFQVTSCSNHGSMRAGCRPLAGYLMVVAACRSWYKKALPKLTMQVSDKYYNK